MKRATRFLAICLVLAIVCSITALFAEQRSSVEDEPEFPYSSNFSSGSGHVSITNATLGQTYYAYQIFGATYNETTGSVAYTIQSDSPWFEYVSASSYFELIEVEGCDYLNYYVVRNNSINNETLLEWISNAFNDIQAEDPYLPYPSAMEVAKDNTITWELPYGYYYIMTTHGNGVNVTIDTNMPDVEVNDKNRVGVFMTKDMVDSIVPIAHSGEIKKFTVQIKSAPNYVPESSATQKPTLITNYLVFDEPTNFRIINRPKLSQGSEDEYPIESPELDSDKDYPFTVTVSSYVDRFNRPIKLRRVLGEFTAKKGEYNLIKQPDGSVRLYIPWGEHVTVTDENGNEKIVDESYYNAPTDIVITYYAEMMAEACGDNYAVNHASAYYNCSFETRGESLTNRGTFIGEAGYNVYNFNISCLKYDSTNGELDNPNDAALVPLANGQFQLYNVESGGQRLPVVYEGNMEVDGSTRAVYHLADSLEQERGEATYTMVTPESGYIMIKGAGRRDYYLEEIYPPPGYIHTAGRIKVSIADVAVTYPANTSKQSTKTPSMSYDPIIVMVGNSRTNLLPQMGGIGTKIFYVVGSVLVFVALTLLITKKKLAATESNQAECKQEKDE